MTSCQQSAGHGISWKHKDTKHRQRHDQDNKSAILMENNGKASSSKQTKHINICYFFITDHILEGKVQSHGVRQET